ncbi:ribosome maturation factor RimP [Alkalibacterium iburiense]|uniref:Ribosome maturation factor RimP n=1 Tax=Alkalibacterium iburiense TaxID=290589 RepID=A0ABN0XQ90_9LACT
MSTVDKVRTISEPIAEELGYDLVDVEYVKEGKHWFLRLYIDKENGVDLDDCALYSERIEEVLDTIQPDPIPHAYYLEVSSPGAERPLKTEKDFQNAVGKYIHLTLHEAVEGESVYEGTLKEWNTDDLVITIKIKTRRKDIVIDTSKIAKARLAIEF